jgi:hypothetical protein
MDADKPTRISIIGSPLVNTLTLFGETASRKAGSEPRQAVLHFFEVFGSWRR